MKENAEIGQGGEAMKDQIELGRKQETGYLLCYSEENDEGRA